MKRGDAGAVDRNGLENRRAPMRRALGSNPSLSARNAPVVELGIHAALRWLSWKRGGGSNPPGRTRKKPADAEQAPNGLYDKNDEMPLCWNWHTARAQNAGSETDLRVRIPRGVPFSELRRIQRLFRRRENAPVRLTRFVESGMMPFWKDIGIIYRRHASASRGDMG